MHVKLLKTYKVVVQLTITVCIKNGVFIILFSFFKCCVMYLYILLYLGVRAIARHNAPCAIAHGALCRNLVVDVASVRDTPVSSIQVTSLVV